MTDNSKQSHDAAVSLAFAKLVDQQRKVDDMVETDPWRSTEIAILLALKATARMLHANFIETHGISADPRDSVEPILLRGYVRLANA